MLWSFVKFSQLIHEGNVWRSVWRICMWILGLKGLTVKPPLMASSLHNGHLFTFATFFGEQSIQWLLFKTLYSGHFGLSPRWQLWRGSAVIYTIYRWLISLWRVRWMGKGQGGKEVFRDLFVINGTQIISLMHSSVMGDLLFSQHVTRDFLMKIPWWL